MNLRSILTSTAVAFCLVTPVAVSAQIQNDAIRRLNSFVQSSATDNEKSSNDFRRGRDFIEEGKWRDAEKLFQEYLQNYPQNKNLDAAMYWLAVAGKKLSHFKQAEEMCNKLLAQFPQSTWANDARALQLEIAPFIGTRDLVNLQIEPIISTFPRIASAGFGDDDARSPQARVRGEVNEKDEIKSIALQSLMRSDPERAIPFIASILSKESKASPFLKANAMHILGQQKDPKATAMLLDFARNEADPKLRRSAIFALGGSDDQKVFDYLVELATKSDDADASKAALQALARSRGDRSRDAIFRLARNAQSPQARRNAIFYLGQRKDDATVQELIKIYDSEQDPGIRKQVVFSLSQNSSPLALNKLRDIMKAKGDDETRAYAIEWLGGRNDEDMVDELVRMYKSEQNEKIRRSVISALSRQAIGRSWMTFSGTNLIDMQYKFETLNAVTTEATKRAVENSLRASGISAAPVTPATPAPAPAAAGAPPAAPVAPVTSAVSPRPARAVSPAGVTGEERKGSAKALKALIDLYDGESNEQLRSYFLYPFSQSRSRDGVHKLVQIARNDSSASLRRKAVSLLSQSKDPEAVKLMEDLLK